MKKNIIVLFAALLLMVGGAFAATPSGADVTDGTLLGPLSSDAAGNTSVNAGTIQTVDLTANQSTLRWAGITGTVSGNIQLGDNVTSKVMYEWSATGNIVYASSVNNPVWASLNGVDAAGAATLDTALSYTGASDDVVTTFGAGTNDNIGSNLFADFGTAAISAATNDDGAVASWITYLLTDGSDYIYAGIVGGATNNFAGTASDFQMIVPENGIDGDSTPTTYFLWAELI